MNLKNKRIVICKTNQIGDVTFALPLASAIKQAEPSAYIIFLGRAYTQSLIEHYRDVDAFADWETNQDLSQLEADVIMNIQNDRQIARQAKLAKIPVRIGTNRRLFNWRYCNKLVNVTRKKSSLHESQLDLQYLKGLGLKGDYTQQEIIALRHYQPFENTKRVRELLVPGKFNLILHPKTRGEHIEWPIQHFVQLIQQLPAERFHLLITGSEQEGEQIRSRLLKPFPHVVDTCGTLDLAELNALIAHADGLIAASTGPVHLAANFGINTLGLYAPIRPFDAGRWGPIGAKAQYLSRKGPCSDCRLAGPCHCVAEISVDEVFNIVKGWLKC